MSLAQQTTQYSRPRIAMLMEVLRMSNEPVKGIDNKFTIDGTGMPTSIKQNYASDKTDDAKRAVYDMLIGMVGVRTKLFSAFAVAGSGGESPHLPPVLEETASIYTNIDCVMADAGYIGRDNCDAISEAGAVPYIFPAQRITLSQKGSMTWKHMLLALVHDPQKWLEEYHLRSISESVNSVWKRKYTRPLARKTRERRTVEALGRIICYNMRRLSYRMRFNEGFSPRKFWRGKMRRPIFFTPAQIFRAEKNFGKIGENA